MAAPAPLLRGPLSAHPLARSFADEVHRIHRRFASEVVARNRLCPHLRDVDTGFGAFCVVLDPRPDPDVEAAVETVIAADNAVIHVVFPLIRPPPSLFERFSGRLAAALKKAIPDPPVMATFHPELAGDPVDAYRLVGLLRRAPDPFVQLIPAGLHEGGTVFAALPTPGAAPPPVPELGVDNAVAVFRRLDRARIEEIMALTTEIQADRARGYAPFLAAFEQRTA